MQICCDHFRIFIRYYQAQGFIVCKFKFRSDTLGIDNSSKFDTSNFVGFEQSSMISISRSVELTFEIINRVIKHPCVGFGVAFLPFFFAFVPSLRGAERDMGIYSEKGSVEVWRRVVWRAVQCQGVMSS